MPINQSIFIFGNSLVNYASGGAETNVPIWMNRFAEYQGNGLAVEGGYGFLRNFADAEEPNTDWGFEGVAEVYDSETTSFAEVAFDNVIITPSNFVQDQSPESPYFDGDRSPLEAMVQIVEGLSETQPDAQIFVYEGWADMAPYAPDGMPNPAELAAYHDYNTGSYHDWFSSLVDQTQEAVVGAEITLIPVASILSEMLSSQPLSEIPVEDLYVDSAPHGTETLYFLASLTSYAAIYGTVPPADYVVPDVVHPAVAVNFVEVTEFLAEALQARGFEVTTPLPGQGGMDEGDEFDFGFGEGEGSAPGDDTTPPAETGGETADDTYYPGEALSIPPEDTPETAPDAETPADEDAAEGPEAEDVDMAEGDVPGLSLGEIEVTHTADYDNVSRTIEVAEGGAYRFELTSDELSTLYINGQPVLTNDGTRPDTSQDVTVELDSGAHLIEIHYVEENGGDTLILDIGPEAALAAAEAEDSFLPGKDFDEIPEEEAEDDLTFF